MCDVPRTLIYLSVYFRPSIFLCSFSICYPTNPCLHLDRTLFLMRHSLIPLISFFFQCWFRCIDVTQIPLASNSCLFFKFPTPRLRCSFVLSYRIHLLRNNYIHYEQHLPVWSKYNINFRMQMMLGLHFMLCCCIYIFAEVHIKVADVNFG